MKSLLLPLNTELKTHENTPFFKRTVCLSVQNMPYLFTMQGFLSRRSSTGLAKKWTLLSIKSFVSSCSRLLSRHATKKQTPPYRLSMAQPVKIEFRLSLALIHWLNTIFHSQNFALQYISPELNSTWLFWWVCFQVLVVYCCLMCKLLPHQVWPLHPRLIRTTNTNIFLFQGLKATYRLAKLSFSISAVSTWD